MPRGCHLIDPGNLQKRSKKSLHRQIVSRVVVTFSSDWWRSWSTFDQGCQHQLRWGKKSDSKDAKDKDRAVCHGPCKTICCCEDTLPLMCTARTRRSILLCSSHSLCLSFKLHRNQWTPPERGGAPADSACCMHDEATALEKIWWIHGCPFY